MNDLQKRRPIRSYVLRQGRMTVAQTRALDELLPVYGPKLSGLLDYPALFKREAPVVLEIGFGMGGSLIEMAKAQPDNDFIGIEVHAPGVGSCLDGLEKAALTNLRVIHHDAMDVLEQHISNGSLDRVQIFFPDPWHKKKHNKRRLIQPKFLDLLISKLKPSGVIHLATDWEHYALQMMDVLSNDSRLVNQQGAQQYADGKKLRAHTKFEARGERLGHGVWDLLFALK
jgi:tRNA (guanine-N7-)-methyltransferase